MDLDKLKKDTILSSKEMAEWFGYKSDDALRKQRCMNRTIFPYFKLGGRVFYRLADILEEVKKNLIKPD